MPRAVPVLSLAIVALLIAPQFGSAAASGDGWQGGDARKGQDLLVERGCRGCHAIDRAEKSVSPRVPNLAGIGLEARGDSPEVALRNGRLLIEFYSCRGCHVVEESGGAIAPYLARKTFAPPDLNVEGARAQSSWLIEFLRKPSRLAAR